MPHIAIDYDKEKLRDFCQRWKVTEFSLFGSVVRDDFGPESDVDVLVTFAPQARRSLFDMVHMEDELVEIFGREVDLLTRRSVEQSLNPIRRDSILGDAVSLDL
ncbi:MAG TPA: nucleotidyltransferase family protein [Thermoanaerobaculia bacterium]|jgi:predicted nucleotidyltransferase|nr:nucleotidyltransferase family protein [Thermoanaerobaculia bacterium]